MRESLRIVPVLARKITFDPHAQKLLVNGEEFPYYIEDAGISVSASTESMTIVTVGIIAEEVEVLSWNKSRVSGVSKDA
jgi:hypothetical protein